MPLSYSYLPLSIVLLLVRLLINGHMSLVNAADFRIDGGKEIGWHSDSSRYYRWYAQTDRVMGGSSTGKLEFKDNRKTMQFSGDISLVGGGFSSVRRSLRDKDKMDLTGYKGILVEVETQRFESSTAPLGLHLQFHHQSSSYGFAAAFTVPISDNGGLTSKVYIPLDTFDRGTRMGYKCSSCSLDVSRIDEIDVYVLFQDVKFDVKLKSISAVEKEEFHSVPSVSFGSLDAMNQFLKESAMSANYLKKQYYEELCIAVGWSSLSTVLTAKNGVSDDLKSEACYGLQKAKKETKKRNKCTALIATMQSLQSGKSGNAAPANFSCSSRGSTTSLQMQEIDNKKDVTEDIPSEKTCLGSKGNCSQGGQSCCNGLYCWGKRKSNRMKCMEKCGKQRMRCNSDDACCSGSCESGKCQK